MKIKITQQEPNAVQEFFSKPLDFSQRVEVKKLQIAGMICKAMKRMGINRKKLAAKMDVKPSRVTAMLDGTQNLTIETIMRASEALDQKFEFTMIPKDHVAHWKSFESTTQHQKVHNVTNVVKYSKAKFVMDSLASDDEALAS